MVSLAIAHKPWLRQYGDTTSRFRQSGKILFRDTPAEVEIYTRGKKINRIYSIIISASPTITPPLLVLDFSTVLLWWVALETFQTLVGQFGMMTTQNPFASAEDSQPQSRASSLYITQRRFHSSGETSVAEGGERSEALTGERTSSITEKTSSRKRFQSFRLRGEYVYTKHEPLTRVWSFLNTLPFLV